MPGRQGETEVGSYIVDPRFFQTVGMEPVAGRIFDGARPADDATRPWPRVPEIDRALVARGLNIVVNESAVQRLGFADAEAAIGKQVRSEIFDDATDNFGPMQVPEGRLFLMGDNRDDSLDSRFATAIGGVGLVPVQNVIGRAMVTFWSTDGSASYVKPWTWLTALRGSRIGNGYTGPAE